MTKNHKKLTLSTEDYHKIAENINRMQAIPLYKRQSILNRANKQIPGQVRAEAIELTKQFSEDPYFKKIAGINFDKPLKPGVWQSAVADYLLRRGFN